MKRIYLFATAFFAIGTFHLVLAQNAPDAPLSGLAGPDQHTCRKNGTTQPVQIGLAGITGYCYYWSPETGLDNPHIPNPKAAPSQTTTYTVKVVTDNFTAEFTDQVTVFLDVINSFTLTEKQCCFKPGDKLSYNQFNITTDPPGLEAQTYFIPSVVPTIMHSQQSVPVLAVIKCEDDSVVHSIMITVINENFVQTTQIALGPIAKAMKALDDIMNLINKGIEVPGNPCEIEVTPNYNILYQEGKLCCAPDSCIKKKNVYAGYVELCAGAECDIYLVGVPGVISLNGVLIFSACLNAQLDYTNTCDGGNVCFTVGPVIYLGGGISGTVLNGAAARVAATLVNQITAPSFKVCVPSGEVKIFGSICYTLEAILTVSFLGGYAGVQYKVPVIPQTCLQ